MATIKEMSIKNASGNFDNRDIGAEAQYVDISYDVNGNIITDITVPGVVIDSTKSLAEVLDEIDIDKSLEDLTDTNINNPSNNQGLIYDEASGKQVNGTVSTGSTSIEDLNDTTITNPTNGQGLLYDSASSKWVNGNVSGGSSTLSGLTDTTISSPANEQVLTYNGTSAKQINKTPKSNLYELNDININGKVNGQVLTYNSSSNKQVNSTISVGSTTLSGLTDTTINSPSNGQVLTYSGSKQINSTPSVTGMTTNGSNAVSPLRFAVSSFSEGVGTCAAGSYSHAEGHNTCAKGYESHAEGYGSCTFAQGAHAEGINTCAAGNASHTEGNSTCAYSQNDHAEGINTCAAGSSSHAEGMYTKAKGTGSHAEGYYSCATNYYAHAEGTTSIAYGSSSHAEGSGSYAYGSSSHAEGSDTCAANNSAHAEGSNSKAFGLFSHAQGVSSCAAGYASHAGGYVGEAFRDYQFVHGRRLMGYQLTSDHGYYGVSNRNNYLSETYRNDTNNLSHDCDSLANFGRSIDNAASVSDSSDAIYGQVDINDHGDIYSRGMRFKARGIINGITSLSDSKHKIYIPKGSVYWLVTNSYLNTTGAYRGTSTYIITTNGGGSSSSALAVPKATAVGSGGTTGVNLKLGADGDGPLGGYTNGNYCGYVTIASCTTACKVEYCIIPLLTPFGNFGTDFT